MFSISSGAKSFRSNFDKLVDNSPCEVLFSLRRKIAAREKLREFSDERVCLFVLSNGRVGIDTLASLLGLAKNAFTYHEPKPLLYELSKLSYEYSGNLDKPYQSPAIGPPDGQLLFFS